MMFVNREAGRSCVLAVLPVCAQSRPVKEAKRQKIYICFAGTRWPGFEPGTGALPHIMLGTT